MEVLHHEDVDESQMTELMLACFDHAYSKDHLEDMISSDKRMPEWGGELYAKEGDKLLGCVGLIYPRAKISGEVKKVGGVRNVCSRPSESRRGVIKKLMKRAHEILEDEVDSSFLMTSKSGVAYNLYKKLGYETVHVPPKAYKKVEDRDPDIEFRDEADPDYMLSLYKRSVEDLSGLVVREDDFFEMAEARGWPDNDDVRTAYKDGDRIGYAMFESSRNSLSVKEFAVEDEHKREFLRSLEDVSEKDYVVISYVNPSYRNILKDMGYHWHDDLWYRIMAKEHGISRLKGQEDFHAGVYEVY